MKHLFKNHLKFNEFKQETIDRILEMPEDSILGGDLHQYLFNSGTYQIIGYAVAEYYIIDNYFSVFNAIEIVRDYEKENFGEVFSDLASAEKVANMLDYIQGEYLLNECDHLQKKHDKLLSIRDFQIIIDEISKIDYYGN